MARPGQARTPQPTASPWVSTVATQGRSVEDLHSAGYAALCGRISLNLDVNTMNLLPRFRVLFIGTLLAASVGVIVFTGLLVWPSLQEYWTVRQLTKVLTETDDDEERYGAALDLSETGSVALPALIAAAKGEEDPEVRQAAGWQMVRSSPAGSRMFISGRCASSHNVWRCPPSVQSTGNYSKGIRPS